MWYDDFSGAGASVQFSQTQFSTALVRPSQRADSLEMSIPCDVK